MKKLVSLAASASLLAVIYVRLDTSELSRAIGGADLRWLALAILLFVPIVLVSALRLRTLAPERAALGIGEASRLIMAAGALNMVLPSKMGDLAKAEFMRREGTLDGAGALVLVVFEKAFDVLALLLWCAFGLLIDHRRAFALVAAIVALTAAAVVTVLASRAVAGLAFGGAARVLPARFAPAVERAKNAWSEAQSALSGDPARTLRVVALSIGLWSIHLVQIWIFILALGGSVPLITEMALAPLAIFAGLVPLTLAGIGTRDAALLLLFSSELGVPRAAALGLLCSLRYLIPALVGLPFAGRYLARARRSAERRPSRSPLVDRVEIWFGASVAAGTVAGALALREAFAGPYVIQDDARQHVFWMASLVDPALFRGDLIAEYFRSVSPPGFRALYQLFALFGVHPLLLAKLLPFALGVATAALAFDVLRRAGARPFVAFLGAWLLVQNLFLLDALTNATPRAFVYPLFLLLLRERIRGSLPGTGVAAAALALFYPQVALVAALALALSVGWSDRRSIAGAALGIALIGAALAPHLAGDGGFGPVLSRGVAKTLPALSPGGRSSFFDPDAARFLLCGERSGLLPLEWCRARAMLLPAAPVLLLLLPVALLLMAPAFDRRLWVAVVLASVALFACSHLLLFRMHLPNRYTQHTLRILLALGAGAAAGRVALSLLERSRHGVPAALLVASALIATPFVSQRVAWHGYVHGDHPGLYAALRRTPKDTRIASLLPEAANLPAFTSRPVLVSVEHALPYHLGYFARLSERAADLSLGESTSSARVLRAVIEKDRIGVWLVARRGLIAGAAITARAEACTIYQEAELVLLDARCLAGR